MNWIKVNIKKFKYILEEDGVFILFRRIVFSVPFRFKRFFNRIFFTFFKRFILKKINNFNSSEELKVFNFIKNSFFKEFSPMQVDSEFLNLLKVYREKGPKTILEIGSANGGTLFCFCRTGISDATLISVDLPEGGFGGGYPEWKKPFFETFKKENQVLVLVRGDSHSEDSVLRIKKELKGRDIDFLFIDGDHSYEGVKKDFYLYKKFLEKGGIIAFHDIAPNGDPRLTGGVPRFWSEIKDAYDTKEFLENRDQKGYGIGVIFL